eukprot:TRINITY_DN5148_c0_g1_i1.p1 TRINITY_DN5148_c0_g1~~TRINITY_DN5148_c0_g1_i1.p1  ORF type:complete len:223 (+),score=35.06 TRINITY_DN5148_c0_g1_i1:96-764(+)
MSLLRANSEPASRVEYPGEWTKEAICEGKGFVVEGVLLTKRTHSVAAQAKTQTLPTKFVALQLKLTSPAKRRNFGPDGKELAPEFEERSKTFKGYLSYEKKDARSTANVTNQELCDILGKKSGGPIPKNLSKPDVLNHLHPKQIGVFEFWLESSQWPSLDLALGQAVRLRTLGDSVLVETITKIDSVTSNLVNYSGETESWTSKIVQRQDDEEKEESEEEWD